MALKTIPRKLLRTILFLLFLEVFLYLGGTLPVLLKAHQNNKALKEHDAYNILCLGESITFPGRGTSYPIELEEALSKLAKGKRFKVINQGIPGTNSIYIVEHLDHWIQEHRPDVIVVMLGINDPFRIVPFNEKSISEKLLSLLEKSKTFKVGRWLVLNLAAKIRGRQLTPREAMLGQEEPPAEMKVEDNNSAPRHESLEAAASADLTKARLPYHVQMRIAVVAEGKKDYAKAAATFQKMAEANLTPPLTHWLYEKSADNWFIAQQFDQLPAVIRKLLALDENDQWVGKSIKSLCQTEQFTAQMKNILEEAIKEKPYSFPLYNFLGACYSSEGNASQGDFYFEKAKSLQQHFFNPITQASYQKLARIASNKNIKLVLMQYPLRNVEALKSMLPENNSQEIIFVDNGPIFRKALAKGKYEDYFTDRACGDFGHLTQLGNRLLAENLARVVLKDVLNIEPEL